MSNENTNVCLLRGGACLFTLPTGSRPLESDNESLHAHARRRRRSPRRHSQPVRRHNRGLNCIQSPQVRRHPHGQPSRSGVKHVQRPLRFKRPLSFFKRQVRFKRPFRQRRLGRLPLDRLVRYLPLTAMSPFLKRPLPRLLDHVARLLHSAAGVRRRDPSRRVMQSRGVSGRGRSLPPRPVRVRARVEYRAVLRRVHAHGLPRPLVKFAVDKIWVVTGVAEAAGRYAGRPGPFRGWGRTQRGERRA